MVFALDTATEADAPRIADIHMAAFHTNGMLLAQFPTPAVRKGLWTSLVDKVVKEIRDPQWEVLVAREADDRVVSFANGVFPFLSRRYMRKSHGYGPRAPIWLF